MFGWITKAKERSGVKGIDWLSRKRPVYSGIMTADEISKPAEERSKALSGLWAHEPRRGRVKVPVVAWTAAILGFGALFLTELVVGAGAGGLVIDWKVGPAFVGLVGSVWGASRARRRLLAEDAEDALIAEEEALHLLEIKGAALIDAVGPTAGES